MLNGRSKEALALSERKRGEWTLLGWDVALRAPVYMCTACRRKRITVVTKGARLPEACDQCGAAQATPPGPFPPPVPDAVALLSDIKDVRS